MNLYQKIFIIYFFFNLLISKRKKSNKYNEKKNICREVYCNTLNYKVHQMCIFNCISKTCFFKYFSNNLKMNNQIINDDLEDKFKICFKKE